MMKRFSFLFALFIALTSSGQALKMAVWDREMQTTLGAGESSGNKFNVQLIKNYSGPVVVIFSQTEEEKKSSTFQGLKTRYDGVLKNGQLTLMPDPIEKAAPIAAPYSAPIATATTTGSVAAQPLNASLSISKLLLPYKLNVVQSTIQNILPPGDNALRSAESGGNNLPGGNSNSANGGKLK